MQIFGKEIKDECSKCGEVLQCELFLQGHGIKRDRENVTEMVSCQMEHQKSRLDKEPKEDLPVKEKCELPPEIKEIYTEVWKIHKECANPKTDDDWSYLIRQGNLLIKIHNNSQFAKALVMAMIDEIEGKDEEKMLGFMILKIMTTLVLTVLAISALWYAPKQKTASDGVILFAFAMFLAFGITFAWV